MGSTCPHSPGPPAAPPVTIAVMRTDFVGRRSGTNNRSESTPTRPTNANTQRHKDVESLDLCIAPCRTAQSPPHTSNARQDYNRRQYNGIRSMRQQKSNARTIVVPCRSRHDSSSHSASHQSAWPTRSEHADERTGGKEEKPERGSEGMRGQEPPPEEHTHSRVAKVPCKRRQPHSALHSRQETNERTGAQQKTSASCHDISQYCTRPACQSRIKPEASNTHGRAAKVPCKRRQPHSALHSRQETNERTGSHQKTPAPNHDISQYCTRPACRSP